MNNCTTIVWGTAEAVSRNIPPEYMRESKQLGRKLRQRQAARRAEASIPGGDRSQDSRALRHATGSKPSVAKTQAGSRNCSSTCKSPEAASITEWNRLCRTGS